MTTTPDPLFRIPQNIESVWSNVRNPESLPGMGGSCDRVAKLEPGERQTIATLQGPGIVDQLYLTLNWPGKKPYPNSMVRTQRVFIEIFWDNAPHPAVSAPLGDFFGHILGHSKPFENALFADPSGRSFLCFVPMPFRETARIELINHFDDPIQVWHDFRYRRGVELHEDDGYLHAFWNRTAPVTNGGDHPILPQVTGRGRYLGTHLGIQSNSQVPRTWHTGHLNFFCDGDRDKPTRQTATLDDYCGSSWDYDLPFMHRDGGLLFSEYFEEGGGHHGLYCYHRRDPLYFHQECRVTFHPQIWMKAEMLVTLHREGTAWLQHITPPLPIAEIESLLAEGENEFLHCGKADDVSSVAFFYINNLDNGLPMVDPSRVFGKMSEP